MSLELKNINGNGGFTLVNTSNGGEFYLVVNGPNNSPSPSVPLLSPSITPTLTPTVSISNTPGLTLTPTPSITTTPTPPASIPLSAPASPSISITPSITRTPSITPSITRTPSVTRTPSITPSVTATINPTPSITPSQGVTVILITAFEGTSSSAACIINNNSAPFAWIRVATLSEDTFTVGKQWYADSGLTTPYPAGYYADLSSTSSNYQKWVRIDTNGIVAEVGSCVSPTPSITPTKTPTPTPTVTPTPSSVFYYYSARKFDCGSSCAQVSPDVVVRSSTPLSTTSGDYYKPLGSFTYQIQTEITPAPMSFDINLDGAPSNANCTSACSL